MTVQKLSEKKIRNATHTLAVDLTKLQTLAHEAGLHATARLIMEATKRLGWEACEKLDAL